MLRKMIYAKLAVILIAGMSTMAWAASGEGGGGPQDRVPAAQNLTVETAGNAVTAAGGGGGGDNKIPDISKLQNALGGATPDSISETAAPGLYEVVMGSQILYLTEDGRFVIQGEVIDLDSADNLTENRRTKLRLGAIDAVGEENMIVFDVKDGKPKHTVTIFTDVDCGYCRKLHREMASYNDLGIRVRYMMFPRAGLKSESFNTAVSVWCADDQQTAMTRAKLGKSIDAKSCANPVEQHYNLGQQLGVRGTPSIILDNGEMVPGYVPAARLAQMFK